MQEGENCSAILQKKIPPKHKDPGSFTVPCKIGETNFTKAMLDLAASINVMPFSIYASLNIDSKQNEGYKCFFSETNTSISFIPM